MQITTLLNRVTTLRVRIIQSENASQGNFNSRLQCTEHPSYTARAPRLRPLPPPRPRALTSFPFSNSSLEVSRALALHTLPDLLVKRDPGGPRLGPVRPCYRATGRVIKATGRAVERAFVARRTRARNLAAGAAQLDRPAGPGALCNCRP
jgi:hypothetical protein